MIEEIKDQCYYLIKGTVAMVIQRGRDEEEYHNARYCIKNECVFTVYERMYEVMNNEYEYPWRGRINLVCPDALGSCKHY